MGSDVPLFAAEGDDEQFFIEGKYALKPKEYSRRKETRYIAIHCSDTPPSLDIGVDIIRTWHTDSLAKKGRGWKDVGYHFVIRRDGMIQRGRPVWAIGAGVLGFNDMTIHVCLVGGRAVPTNRAENRHPVAEDNFTAKQMASLKFLTANIKKHLAPGAMVQGHRDFPDVDKACPSFEARLWWEHQEKDAMDYYTQDKGVFQ